MDVMSQFMDVITTFKCKVCEFVCTKQTELFDHVKTEHLPSTSAKSSGTSLDTKPPELAVGEGAEAQTAAILAGLVDETGNTGSYIAGSNMQPVNIQKFVNGNPTEQVVYLDSGENQSQVFLNKNSALDSKGAFICGSCHSSFEDVEKCKKHMVEAHKLEIGVISDSPAAIVLDLDFSSQTENTGDPAATLLSVGKDADTIISGREERPDGKSACLLRWSGKRLVASLRPSWKSWLRKTAGSLWFLWSWHQAKPRPLPLMSQIMS
ncbi:hypothetical protein EB796_010367 [Bugula neritina]|uniref:C2H2-type domain-containing protein n=1 Tax=Bugula neritina TaxID=10212 RepID=A0A7J7JZF9_BUGNE|nr:hypothetical protein EB796_010367 [Bugula neritina]